MPFNRSNGTLVLDNAVLHRQMGLRGITAHQLAKASGLTPETLSRIRRGYIRVMPSTMTKITKGLLKFPILEGAELLLVAPDANGHDDAPPAVVPVRKARRPLWPDEGNPPARVDGRRVIEERPSQSHKPAAATK